MVEMEEMAAELREAVSRGEIAAWFQPQYDLRTLRVVAAEALCRWLHPAWGMVSPDIFIPLAEDQGSIDDIGRYMAVQAIATMAEWEVDMSVNVSPVQLGDARFTAWLAGVISRVRRPARRLTVEITEGRPLDAVPPLVARLDQLRALGVGVAIDDFGTGQASLTQALRLHATELKIDRSLVEDDSTETAELVIDAVTRAHEANIRVVAEGVETTEQLEKVTRFGCDRAQGYLWSRPIPRDQMARLIAA